MGSEKNLVLTHLDAGFSSFKSTILQVKGGFLEGVLGVAKNSRGSEKPLHLSITHLDAGFSRFNITILRVGGGGP
jgi:hypothetical protein